MDRRNFIKASSVLSTSLLLPKFLSSTGLGLLNSNSNGHKLVIIQLSGGNDGLNTFIPYTNDDYFRNRPFIGITKNEALKLTDEMGLHPKMPGIKQLYDEGYLSVINSVGYPNPNRSHFRSMDIWHSASDSNEYLNTGWLGRYLDSDCPSNCKGSIDAIEVDDSISLALKGSHIKGMAIQYPRMLYNNISEPFIQDLTNHSNSINTGIENNLFLHKTLVETSQNAAYIYNKLRTYNSKIRYPQNQFSNQLKLVARLIGSGCKSSVYYISQNGFDTHVAQSGKHKRQLTIYSQAVSAFVDDLKSTGNFDNTLIVTFSEFGRRVKQNGSRGTDHGTANNVSIISGKLKKPGFYNGAPDLSDLESGDLKHQIDFRSIYATLLNNWMGSDDTKILGSKFNRLDFI